MIDVELGEIYIDTELPKTEIEINQLRPGPLRDVMERRKLQDNTEVEINKQKMFVEMVKLLVQLQITSRVNDDDDDGGNGSIPNQIIKE